MVISSLEQDPLAVLRGLQPKIVGVSVLSTEHNWLIDTTKAIRRALPEVVIITGGIHAMFYPEEILNESSTDIVCHSEGEEVLVNLLEELVKPLPNLSDIPGISYRDNGKNIRTNEKAVLVPFNDEIIEDRDIYYRRYQQLGQDTVHRFFSSRGCPYRCSFCYNSNIQNMFKGKGDYVRQKTVENLIQEIVLQRNKYPMTSIFFYDDLFTFNKKWLERFLDLYKSRVGIPFMCTTRANLMNEDTARMLAEAGCRTASFGIETGNFNIRKNILKKDITDDQIVRCGQLLRKYGIKVQTANMFCLPDETVRDAYKTIELNIRAQTDYAFSALFMPFPKTQITDYCIRQGYIKPDYALKDLPYSFLTTSILNLPDKAAIMNIHHMAYFFIKWPWTFRVFKNLVQFSSLNIFFKILFMLSNLLRHKEERGISYWHAVRYAWRMRKSF